MIDDEFIHLSPHHQYEFRLYYGEVKYGILSENHANKKIYLIRPAKIRVNNGGKACDGGEPVSIDGITRLYLTKLDH